MKTLFLGWELISQTIKISPGNIRLHRVVNQNRDRYLGAARDEKNSIAKTIVKGIKAGAAGEGEQPGRFLKRSEDGGDFWYVVVLCSVLFPFVWYYDKKKTTSRSTTKSCVTPMFMNV
jgi:hypothetical protein